MDYTNAPIDDVIKRINELYKKSKEEGLNEQEKEEYQSKYSDAELQLAGVELKNRKN